MSEPTQEQLERGVVARVDMNFVMRARAHCMFLLQQARLLSEELQGGRRTDVPLGHVLHAAREIDALMRCHDEMASAKLEVRQAYDDAAEREAARAIAAADEQARLVRDGLPCRATYTWTSADGQPVYCARSAGHAGDHGPKQSA